MSLIRYNWLKRCGYRVVSQHRFHDPNFEVDWIEVTLQKNNRLKKTNLSLKQIAMIENTNEP